MDEHGRRRFGGERCAPVPLFTVNSFKCKEAMEKKDEMRGVKVRDETNTRGEREEPGLQVLRTLGKKNHTQRQ